MEINIDRPYPKQIEFFEAHTKYIAYGGARGGGKSWAARIKAVLLALNNQVINYIKISKNFQIKEGDRLAAFYVYPKIRKPNLGHNHHYSIYRDS